MRTVKLIVVIAVAAALHYALSVFLLLLGISAKVHEYQTGNSPSLIQRAAHVIYTVVWFPLEQVLNKLDLKYDSWCGLMFVWAHHIAWGVAIVFAIKATCQLRRFSLRTLLIATTLVAVVLGLIMVAMRWPAG